MVDAQLLRENPDQFKKLISSGRGNPKKADVDKWLELDKKRRELIQKLDETNRKKNELAKSAAQGNIDEIRTKGKELKEEAQKLEQELNLLTQKWEEIIAWVPNLPVSDEEMPDGSGEHDNVVIRAWLPGRGELPEEALGRLDNTIQHMPDFPIHSDQKDFTPQHHLDLGTELGVIDNEQGAKVSGTRFTYLIGDLVLLQYAIQQLLFSELIARGFTPLISPMLVKSPTLYGTSHFPEGRDQVYKIDSENVEENQELFLLGSSEPSNFSLFMDRTLNESDLPYKVFAYTPCFRSEAGSWGRDTKGIKRMHQFDKIEMNVVCTPEQSSTVFDELLSVNEWLLHQLQLPYRLVLKCKGDAGYLASAKQIDPEVWLGGQQEFMEVMTDTNTTDFQARGLNIKYLDKQGKKHFVHTVNDTGVAMGRMLIAIMDNYQQADGSIKVPAALVPFVKKEIITKRPVRL